MNEKRRMSTRRVAAVIVGAAALGAGATFGATSALDSPPRSAVVTAVPAAHPASISAATGLTPTQIYDQATPGVVDIQVTSTTSAPFGFFDGRRQQQGEGSGFVLDTKGDIVTNQHVVSGATSVTVQFSDGSTAKAAVVGSDPGTDVAVIHVDVDASKLHPLSLGTSSSVKPGEGVVAIGSPFGLAGSMTAGIVSAVGRTIDAPDGTPITGAIQTDASINHGNSGGPLIDANGDVVGMNSQIDSNSGGSDGVGFAIPIDTVDSVATQLIAGKTVQHAYLGVQIQTVTPTAASTLSIPVGAQVAQVVAGSPADRAGLKAGAARRTVGGSTYTTDGDVIVAVDGTAIASASDLQAAIAAHKPGDSVTLKVSRSGSERSVTVTLGTRPKA